MKKSILLLISLFAIMLAVSACNTNSGNVEIKKWIMMFKLLLNIKFFSYIIENII